MAGFDERVAGRVAFSGIAKAGSRAQDSGVPNAPVHFWDMDHTILDCDCEGTWKKFLVEKGLARATDLDLMARFGRDYDEGVLDVEAYNDFLLKEFAGQTEEEMRRLSEEHFKTSVRRAAFSGVKKILRRLKASGALLCLITASNLVLARPVARYFGFGSLIATGLDILGDRYTGRITGRYCFGSGKIPLMDQFCRDHGLTLAVAAYYGDSINDVPILEAVGYPVATNPSPLLLNVATARGWRILDFRTQIAPE